MKLPTDIRYVYQVAPPSQRRFWLAALAPAIPWREAYVTIEREARAYLSTRSESKFLTSEELVTALMGEPVSALRFDVLFETRQRLYKGLMALASRGLADCCQRGREEIRGKKGRPVRPWRWHAPTTPHSEAITPPTCPHCGGDLSGLFVKAGARKPCQR